MDSPTSYRRVFLFSGHMIDALGCGNADLGICGGACGGDLLFAELTLARGAHLLMLLPLDEANFLTASVDFAGPQWRRCFVAVKNNPRTTTREAPAVLGPLPPGMDTYERENRWLLDTALGHRPAPLAVICLWNGAGGDGPGGTRHMLSEVERRGARVHWLDTRALWSL